MALMQRNVFKLAAGVSSSRMTSSLLTSSPNNLGQIKKSVFISQSNDVYTNLALESWIYKNLDLSNHHILLLSKNDPCVIIGSNQNPWVETNMADKKNENTMLARRPNLVREQIYNDNGNLNLTFFTPTQHYNKKYNMDIITRALFRKYNIKVNENDEENLSIYGKNLAATGSKIGENNAYHHCSLLIDVNKEDVENALHKKQVDTKTTSSVIPVKNSNLNFMNVRDVSPKARLNDVLTAIGWEFMRTHPVNYPLKDGGMELALNQKGFQMVNPTEKWFPGLTEIRENYETWDWCFGKTPKFSITRQFPIPQNLLQNNYEGTCPDLCITIKVEHGRIEDVTLFIPPGLTQSGFSGEAKVITSLKGHKFSEDALNSLEWYLGVGENSYADDKDKFVTECFRQVMTSV